MIPYSSYIDSGVEWIGEIPSHWDTRKVKYIFEIKKNISGEEGYDVLSVTQQGIKIKDIITGKGQLSMDYTKYQIVNIGDFVMNHMDLLTGYVDISNYLGVTSPDYRVFSLVDEHCVDRYYLYLFQMGYKNKIFYGFGQGSSMFGRWRLPSEEFNNFKFPYPIYEEQKQIVSFLDYKTQQIDDLIEKTEKKIELMKEKRTSLINHCVTKGLNPSVEMKDSGVEWIGEIPKGWNVSKFNFYIQLRHGYQFREYDFTDEGIKIVKITQLHKDGYLDISNCSFIDESRIDEFPDIVIRENDILMCLTGGTIGKIIRVGIVKEPLLQNYRVGHFSSKKQDRIRDGYIFWLMTSDVINGQIFYEIRETGQPNIGLEDFGKMKICLPTIPEQTQIIEYLDEHTQKIDSTIEKETQRIELLKEYRQSLISEVVTGKIDVREWKQ